MFYEHVINHNDLQFGVIYVYTSLYAPPQLLDDYIASAGRACGQAEALRRFKVEVSYVDCAPMLVARRFNAGNIGKAAVITCPVCGDIDIDGKLVNEFVRCLFDFCCLDNGDLNINLDRFFSASERADWENRLEDPDLMASFRGILWPPSPASIRSGVI